MIALTIVLVVHSLLSPQAIAQNLPAEEDIIWRLKAPNEDYFNFVHYLDEARFLVVNLYSIEIRSTVDGSLIQTAPSDYTGTTFHMNESKTHFTTAYEGKAYLWEVESLSKIDTFALPDRFIAEIITSESGRFVAGRSGSSTSDRRHVWDRETGEEIYINDKIDGGTNWGYAMAFSGDTLLALAEDQTYFFDLRTMEKTYVNVKGKYTFSPDGTKMAFIIPRSGTLTTSYFRMMDVATKKVTEQAITNTNEPRTVTFSQDSRRLFFDRTSILHKMDVNNLNIIGTQKYAKNFGVSPQETEIITIGVDSSLSKHLYKLRMNLKTSIIDSIPTIDAFTITPNIVTEFATINCPAQPNSEVGIRVYSVGGELIDMLPIPNPLPAEGVELPFNLSDYSHLANGQYFLELIINGHPTESLPFIIQR